MPRKGFGLRVAVVSLQIEHPMFDLRNLGTGSSGLRRTAPVFLRHYASCVTHYA
jgi:hypothetical protein